MKRSSPWSFEGLGAKMYLYWNEVLANRVPQGCFFLGRLGRRDQAPVDEAALCGLLHCWPPWMMRGVMEVSWADFWLEMQA